MNPTLLIELRTEELPPKALNSLGQHFAAAVEHALKQLRLLSAQSQGRAYASPRRLAVTITDVAAWQEDEEKLRRGPAVSAGLKNGEATPALLGFARSCQVAVEDLIRINDGKQEVFAYASIEKGRALVDLMAEVLNEAVKKLPIPKVMHWGSGSDQFVRPVHGLVVLHGTEIVPAQLFGLRSGRLTYGHRIMAKEALELACADDYAIVMQEKGWVLADFAARRQVILQDLQAAAAAHQATLACDDALVDEVTALVEWPVVLEGGFEEHFLSVPQECLILTMQQNQKYFPLIDAAGKLMNRFLLVANLVSRDPTQVVAGNERVLRARLADAAFFYQQDLKMRLESRLERLANVVYHHKLGSQKERVARLCQLAQVVAAHAGANQAEARRAALLCKADLVTEMVGEFPELQGVMGEYYARHDGESATVAQAIGAHYHPRFAGDSLPGAGVATAVALADKLETLVGIWGIGLTPTGDKDPFALRRSALGILRMMMRDDLPLEPLLQAAFATFPQGSLKENTVAEVLDFMRARLQVLLENDYSRDEVAAVLAKPVLRPGEIPAKLAALAEFKQLPQAAALAVAHKRVGNILKKNAKEVAAHVEATLLQQDEEKALASALEQWRPQIESAAKAGDFQAALASAAQLKPAVDAFFDQVMVMAEDAALRQNRLALLAALFAALNEVADIGALEIATVSMP